MSEHPQTQESLHFLDYWQVVRSRKEVVVAVFLLVVLAGTVVTFSLPKVYSSASLIGVREESPDLPVFTAEKSRYNPFYLRTQFEVIQSRPILEQVVKNLGLDQRLGAAYGFDQRPDRIDIAARMLAQQMSVQQYRDTNLIEIRIRMSDEVEKPTETVAETANMVATVFRDHRLRQNQVEKEKALQALYDAFLEQKKKVDEQEQLVNELRQKHQIDTVQSTGSGAGSLAKLSLQQLEARRIQVRLEVAEKKVRFESVNRLAMGDLLDAAPYVVNDPALSGLVAEKRRMEIQLSQLTQTYGPKHPEVQRATAMIAETDSKIRDALNGLKTGVRADYEAAAAKLEILDAELDELKTQERQAESGGYREFEAARTELEHRQRIADVLEMRYLQEKIELKIPRTIVDFVEPAKPPAPDQPVSPNIYLNIILSILVGLVAGVGLAYFVEYLDVSVKTIDELEHHIGGQVLGVVPQKTRPLTDTAMINNFGEPYRLLRANIQFSRKLRGEKVLAVTSAGMGEGKSLTVFNLAHISAQMGDKVLIVDADLHRPTQHKLLQMSNETGLANFLVGDAALDEIIRPTVQANLSVIPSGRLGTGARGLLDSWKMKDLLKELKTHFDWVYFDSPPIMGISDTSILVREVDGVLLVVQHRKYPRAMSQRARHTLESVGANLVGVVVNNINISRDYSYYYYQQRGGYK